MTTSESKARFFLQNESILIDSHNESNRFESRIGMLYYRYRRGVGTQLTSTMNTGIPVKDSTFGDPTKTTPVEVANHITGSSATSPSSCGVGFYFQCAVLVVGERQPTEWCCTPWQHRDSIKSTC